jgi:hypothetical protein
LSSSIFFLFSSLFLYSSFNLTSSSSFLLRSSSSSYFFISSNSFLILSSSSCFCLSLAKAAPAAAALPAGTFFPFLPAAVAPPAFLDSSGSASTLTSSCLGSLSAAFFSFCFAFFLAALD